MLVLRSVFGLRRRDKIRNDYLMNKPHVESFTLLKKCKNDWRNHAQRMTENRIPVQIMHYRLHGMRRDGKTKLEVLQQA
jgi:hypothetical protein